MGAENLGRDEARDALAQLERQGAAVRRWDLDRLGLLVTAAVLVGYSLLVAALAGRTHFFVLFVPAPALLISGFGLWRERNQRVFSKGGRPVVYTSLVASVVFFALLQVLIAPRLGWAIPDWHFVVISLLAVVPLLIGAWLIGRLR